MNRIILHWTAGTHTPSGSDKAHYHFVIDGQGRTHNGKWPVSANAVIPKGSKNYAAHTLNANTGAIGIAVAAMAGAQERPFVAGSHPITPAQVQTLVTLCRKLMAEYGIEATRQTVLSHAEVQPTLGIKQKGKWDIAWLPGMDKPGDPVKVGDHIRGLINAKPVDAPPIAAKPVADSKPVFSNAKPAKPPVGGIIGAILALIAGAAIWWGGL